MEKRKTRQDKHPAKPPQAEHAKKSDGNHRSFFDELLNKRSNIDLFGAGNERTC